VLHRRIDEWKVASVASFSRSEAGVDRIDASAHSNRPPLFDLVGHRIGERADRMAAGDRVAVVVQEGVELAQARLAMASEDPEGRRAEGAAPEELCVGGQRRDGWLVVGGRPAALLPRQDRPQEIAKLLRLPEALSASTGQVEQLTVEYRYPGEDLVAFDLQTTSLDRVNAAATAAGAEAAPQRMVARPSERQTDLPPRKKAKGPPSLPPLIIPTPYDTFSR